MAALAMAPSLARLPCSPATGASRRGRCSIQRNDAAATGPLVKPSSEFSLEEAVRVQLDSLARNDEPRQDHGLEVMYLFANAEGALDEDAAAAAGTLPCYFGYPADLYHFGHFALKFRTRYPELINLESYEINQVLHGQGSPRRARVYARTNTGIWVFAMSKLGAGPWLTDSLVKFRD